MFDIESIRSFLAISIVPITINVVVILGLMMLDQSLFKKWIQNNKFLGTLGGSWSFMTILVVYLALVTATLVVPSP